MDKDFLSMASQTIVDSEDNLSVTENGARGFKSTGKALVDINFAVSSLRGADDDTIISKFSAACAENLDLAIMWLFFARDIRGGMGERRLFRVCLKYLAREFPDKVRNVLPLVPEYGRWDDVMCLLDSKVQDDVAQMVKKQLAQDAENCIQNKPISLLAKWMPSINASSSSRRELAEVLAKKIGLQPMVYQKTLASLRSYLNVVEKKMSNQQWDEIQYSAVPSRANLLYNKAFLRHDEERRRDFLSKVEKGEEKINAGAVFPHDIVHKYGCRPVSEDATLEFMWKALPNTVKDGEGTIVVADGSGSMWTNVGDSRVEAIEVANALAIYFAERLPKPYKDKYITFSTRPQIVDLGGGTTLFNKLKTAYCYCEVANTNIEAVFDLILNTAERNHLKQDQIPNNILIISDMEFDEASEMRVRGRWVSPSMTLFDNIRTKYELAGYKMPRLVFWNVCSRTGTIPVKENDLGVALVSGFSPNIAKMVMSNKTDPYEVLVDTLKGERYAPVADALKR